MTEREALKLALEALELSHPRFGIGTAIHIKAVAVIKEALAQPEQEPVAWIDKMVIDVPNQILYTAPQRTWVGLTDEEIKQMGLSNYIKVVRETEAKLKEKNT